MTAKELLELHPYCVALDRGSPTRPMGRIIGYCVEPISYHNFWHPETPIEYGIIIETTNVIFKSTFGFTTLPGACCGVDSRTLEIVTHSLQCKSMPTKAVVPTRFPHKCPACGGNAYIGFTNVEHERGRCERR